MRQQFLKVRALKAQGGLTPGEIVDLEKEKALAYAGVGAVELVTTFVPVDNVVMQLNVTEQRRRVIPPEDVRAE